MPDALLDSNVVVAIVAGEHQGHAIARNMVRNADRQSFAVAAHSFAEAYSTLTRRDAAAQYRWPAEDAAATLRTVLATMALVGLTPTQTFEAIGKYAAIGGTGPRLYDRLIGEVALVYGFSRIVTWNIRHMRSLFPQLDVVEPAGAI